MHNFTHQNFTLNPARCTQPRLHVHTQQSKQCKKNMKGEKTLDNSEQKQSQVQRLEIFLRCLQAKRKISASKWGQSEKSSLETRTRSLQTLKTHFLD